MVGVSERLGEIAQKYQYNAVNAAPVWSARASSEAEKWEQNAKSAQAEQNYATAMEYVIQNQLRLKGLQGVSAQDFASAVSGAQDVYAYKVSVSGNKWQEKFSPYAQVIDRVVATLPPKVPGQVRENIMNRVVPIAEALHQQKISGVVARTMGLPTPTGPGAGYTPRYPFRR